MAFLPVRFEELAQEILDRIRKNSLEDAKARTVVSRVYYSCFLTAREKLSEVLSVEKRQIIKNGKLGNKKINIHYLVIEAYRRSSDSFHQYIGERLESLRKRRNKADYNLYYKMKAPMLEILAGRLLRKDIERVQNKNLLAESFSEVIEEIES